MHTTTPPVYALFIPCTGSHQHLHRKRHFLCCRVRSCSLARPEQDRRRVSRRDPRHRSRGTLSRRASEPHELVEVSERLKGSAPAVIRTRLLRSDASRYRQMPERGVLYRPRGIAADAHGSHWNRGPENTTGRPSDRTISCVFTDSLCLGIPSDPHRNL